MAMPADTRDPSAEPAADAAVLLFRSLGDATRVAILQHLALGEHRVVDLTAHLGLAQSTVSAHLACLRDCGLVSSRPVGRASVFTLAVPDELTALLLAAERLLAATGDAVTLCRNLDAPATTGVGARPERYAPPASGSPSRSSAGEERPQVPLAVRRRAAAGGQR